MKNKKEKLAFCCIVASALLLMVCGIITACIALASMLASMNLLNVFLTDPTAGIMIPFPEFYVWGSVWMIAVAGLVSWYTNKNNIETNGLPTAMLLCTPVATPFVVLLLIGLVILLVLVACFVLFLLGMIHLYETTEKKLQAIKIPQAQN